jgi:hypothetical protein
MRFCQIMYSERMYNLQPSLSELSLCCLPACLSCLQRPDGYPAEIKSLNSWSEYCAVARVGTGAAYYPGGEFACRSQQQQ